MAKNKSAFISKLLSPVGITLLIVLAVALGAGGMYVYSQNNEPPQDEIVSLQKKLSAFMDLPPEAPTLATVSDSSKLSNEPFFANAQNGDKVLIYAVARKAILYRPSTEKVIEVGPINLGGNPVSAAPVASPSAAVVATPAISSQVTPTRGVSSTPAPSAKPIKVVIYNGTLTTGLAKTAEAQIEKESTAITVIKRTDAAKADYGSSVVVDLSGSMSMVANQLAKSVKGKVAALPKGEAKPEADILIILGASYQAE